MAATDTPYRTGLRTGLSAALSASTGCALFDAVWATKHGATMSVFVPLLGLWSVLGLVVGIGVGMALGAGNAQWGEGFITRGHAALRADVQKDRAAAAIVMTAAVVAGLFAVATRVMAVKLVAGVARVNVGALLLGVVLVAVLLMLGVVALPTFRAMRVVARLLPRIGPISRFAIVLGGGLLAVLSAALLFVFTRLDWRVLGIESLLALVALPVLTLWFGWLFRGPLAGLAARTPAVVPWVAAGLALGSAGFALGTAPAPATAQAVIDRSLLGSRMIPVLRALKDGDRDGYSAFWHGPDCDDRNANVNPAAREVPGNGIDDNCAGGDAAKVTAEPVKPAIPVDGGTAGSAANTATSGTPNPATPATTPGLPGAKNVLIVFVDTLRYDRLGVAGYRRDGKSLTPNIDAFAAKAANFSQAYAQAPNTPRSVPSFLASRYPSQVAVEKSMANYPSVLDSNVFLFEQLQSAGVKTIAKTSHFYFCDGKRAPADCEGFADKRHTNVQQGADEWDNSEAVDIAPSNKDIASPRVVPKAIAALEDLAKAPPSKGFAMMVHLFEPHSTYVEHEGYPITETSGDAKLSQRYDYEIAFMDNWFGKLMATLDATGLANDTLVVLVADHGEAFGTHSFAGNRMFFHGQTLYNELIRVPLLFRGPGVTPGERKEVVELVDLAPTIAAALGVPVAPSWVGHSLLDGLQGKPLAAKPAFAELLPAPSWDHNAKAMITADGKYKAFYRISDRQWEIYDLSTDPDEKKNLADNEAIAGPIKQQLIAWMEGPLVNAPN